MAGSLLLPPERRSSRGANAGAFAAHPRKRVLFAAEVSGEKTKATARGSTATSTAVSSISSASSGPSIHHLGFRGFDIRALITGNQFLRDHHEYMIEVTTSTSTVLTPTTPSTPTPPLIILRRYRAFDRLHRHLTRIAAKDGEEALFCPLPDMPPKKYFGSRNPRFVARRQRALQTYLDGVLIALSGHGQQRGRLWTAFCQFLTICPEGNYEESPRFSPTGFAGQYISQISEMGASTFPEDTPSMVAEMERSEQLRCQAIVEGMTNALVDCTNESRAALEARRRPSCNGLDPPARDMCIDESALRRLFAAIDIFYE